MQSFDKVATVSTHVDQLAGISFSPDSQSLITVGYDGMIQRWETDSWSQIANLQSPSELEAHTITADGQWLLVGGDPG